MSLLDFYCSGLRDLEVFISTALVFWNLGELMEDFLFGGGSKNWVSLLSSSRFNFPILASNSDLLMRGLPSYFLSNSSSTSTLELSLYSHRNAEHLVLTASDLTSLCCPL